jgi:hypothetical protein
MLDKMYILNANSQQSLVTYFIFRSSTHCVIASMYLSTDPPRTQAGQMLNLMHEWNLFSELLFSYLYLMTLAQIIFTLARGAGVIIHKTLFLKLS